MDVDQPDTGIEEDAPAFVDFNSKNPVEQFPSSDVLK